MKIEHNVCETCGADNGRAGLLISKVWAMIAAKGKIPDDLRTLFMTESQVEQALFRVEPLEFMGNGQVKCIDPSDHKRFDELLQTQ